MVVSSTWLPTWSVAAWVSHCQHPHGCHMVSTSAWLAHDHHGCYMASIHMVVTCSVTTLLLNGQRTFGASERAFGALYGAFDALYGAFRVLG